MGCLVLVLIGIFLSFVTNVILRRRASKDYSDDVMDAVPHLLAIHHLKSGKMVYNQRWTEYVGADPQPTNDHDFWGSVVHQEDFQKIIDQYLQACAEQKSFSFEYRIKRHDGEWRWHLVRGEFVRDRFGVVTKCVSTSTDVHPQKESHVEKIKLLEEIETKSNMLSAVIDQMPMGVVIAGVDRKVITQNKRMKQFFDFGPNHKVGSLVGYKPDGSRVQSDEWVIMKALISGMTEKMEFNTSDEKFGDRIFHSLASPIFSAEGNIVGAVSIIEDITEYRKKAAQIALENAQVHAAKEIRKSQKFLEDMVDNIPHLIFMKDAETLQYVKLNQACQALFPPGFNVIGKTAYDIYTKEQADEMVKTDLEAIETNKVIEVSRHEVTIAHVGIRTYQTKKFVVESENGRKVIVGVSSDISDLVAAERKMIQAKEQAESVGKMKSEFLANMSHEIRTPLNGVIGVTELILEGSLDSEQRKFVHMVRDSGTALLAIVNDVLDFSKVESGFIELEDLDFELRTTFTNHLELLRMRAKLKEIDLDYQFDSQLPSFVKGDPNRIVQVLNNLIGNAIKFTADGGTIKIRADLVEAKVDFTTVRFEVKDTGIGLTPEEQAKLFRPFVQADGSMARKYGGTGLGLSICKQLVELMNGTIFIESKKGEGSSFVFFIRFGTSLFDEKNPSICLLPVRSESIAIANATGKHVLLVEDNEINQNLVQAILKRLGYTADTVKNGNEAVAAAFNREYDVILMDCQMPELDGFQATTQIREIEKNLGKRVPVVALTANARAEDRDRCLASGMDDFISKPIKRETLNQILAKWTKTKVSA